VARNNRTRFLDIRLLAALAGLAAFLVYLPALQNGFVTWDDGDYVYANDFIRRLSLEFLGWAFSAFHAANWHPLTWISHALDYAAWGLDPFGHHLTNNLLHAANTLLVTLFTYRVLKIAPVLAFGTSPDERTLAFAALVTGLLFGLHPLHVESVAWVSERKDLLCAFFYLLSLQCYMRLWPHQATAVRAADILRSRPYLGCLALFALALMSKPMAVSLPVALLLLDWLRGEGLDRPAWRRLLLSKAPFYALALASAMVTVAAQHSGDAITELEATPLLDRIWVACIALVTYLANMAWPSNLAPFYPYPEKVDWLSIQYLGAAVLVATITLAVLLKVRRGRFWAFAWGYYLITLAPVLGLVKVGSQAMADRYTYLPSIAPFMAFALALAWVLRRAGGRQARPGVVLAASAATVLVLCAALAVPTAKQISIWKDGDTLWRYAIRQDATNYIAFKNLGNSQFERGEYAEAARTMEQAAAMGPVDAQLLNNLAICYMELGDLDRAEANARRSLAVRGDQPSALNTLGEIYLAREDYFAANQAFFQAMELEPDNPLRLFNLAVSFDKLYDTEQSCTWWRRFMDADLSGEHDGEIREHLAGIGCPVTPDN